MRRYQERNEAARDLFEELLSDMDAFWDMRGAKVSRAMQWCLQVGARACVRVCVCALLCACCTHPIRIANHVRCKFDPADVPLEPPCSFRFAHHLRPPKLRGEVSPRYPDFKHKERDDAVWLSRVPEDVIERLAALDAARGTADEGGGGGGGGDSVPF